MMNTPVAAVLLVTLHINTNATAGATPKAQPLVIVGDLVNLRAAPSVDAAIVARLHINTAVVLTDEKPGWVRIAVARRPDLVGYVAQELVGDVVTMDTLNNMTARGPDEELKRARRAVALDPSRGAGAHEMLRDALRATGDEAGARAIERHLRGENPIYIAQCAGDRAVLIGIDDGKSMRFPARGELRTLATQLDAARWFTNALSDYGPHVTRVGLVEGSPFPTPRVAPLWNDEMDNGPTNDDGDKLILGPCPVEGAIFATTPFKAFEPEGVALDDASRLQGALVKHWDFAGARRETVKFRAFDAVRPFPEAKFFVARLTVRAIFADHYGDADRIGSVTALFDATQKRPASKMLTIDRDTKVLHFAAPMIWIQPTLIENDARRIGFAYTEADDGRATHIMTVRGDAPIEHDVAGIDSWGC